MSDEIARKGMELPAREVHIRRGGNNQSRELTPEFWRMSGVYTRLRSGFEEPLETLVSELPDHETELYSVTILPASRIDRRRARLLTWRR